MRQRPFMAVILWLLLAIGLPASAGGHGDSCTAGDFLPPGARRIPHRRHAGGAKCGFCGSHGGCRMRRVASRSKRARNSPDESARPRGSVSSRTGSRSTAR
jgi:hypothetical protein